MTEPKFTPGPWHWHGEDFSMLILCRNGDPFDAHVLTMTMCSSCHDRAKAENRKHWRWGDCHTAKQADARLIAAAPDLYEALKALIDEPFHFDDARYIELDKRARAALSKAVKP